MSDWIKCSERLPEQNRRVLVFSNRYVGGIVIAQLLFEGEFSAVCYEYPLRDITHWMPLPEPPK